MCRSTQMEATLKGKNAELKKNMHVLDAVEYLVKTGVKHWATMHNGKWTKERTTTRINVSSKGTGWRQVDVMLDAIRLIAAIRANPEVVYEVQTGDGICWYLHEHSTAARKPFTEEDRRRMDALCETLANDMIPVWSEFQWSLTVHVVHQVPAHTGRCDCRRFKMQGICQHALAVALMQGDIELPEEYQNFADAPDGRRVLRGKPKRDHFGPRKAQKGKTSKASKAPKGKAPKSGKAKTAPPKSKDDWRKTRGLGERPSSAAVTSIVSTSTSAEEIDWRLRWLISEEELKACLGIFIGAPHFYPTQDTNSLNSVAVPMSPTDLKVFITDVLKFAAPTTKQYAILNTRDIGSHWVLGLLDWGKKECTLVDPYQDARLCRAELVPVLKGLNWVVKVMAHGTQAEDDVHTCGFHCLFWLYNMWHHGSWEPPYVPLPPGYMRFCLRLLDFLEGTGDIKRQDGDPRMIELHADTAWAINHGAELGEPQFEGVDQPTDKIMITLAAPERHVLEADESDATSDSDEGSTEAEADVVVSDDDFFTSEDSGEEPSQDEEESEEAGSEHGAGVKHEVGDSDSEDGICALRQRNVRRNDAMLSALGIEGAKAGLKAKKSSVQKPRKAKAARKGRPPPVAEDAAQSPDPPAAAEPSTTPPAADLTDAVPGLHDEAEQRIDCRDRGLWRKYSKAQFALRYGGDHAWNNAPRLTEHRTSDDKTCSGTVEAFITHFGERWQGQWFRAAKAPAVQQQPDTPLEHAGTPTGARTMREMLARGELFYSPAQRASAGVQTSPPESRHSVGVQSSPPAPAPSTGSKTPPPAKPQPKATAAPPPAQADEDDVEEIVRRFLHRRFPTDGGPSCRALARIGWVRMEEMASLRTKKPVLAAFRAEGFLDGRTTHIVSLLRKLSTTRCALPTCRRPMAVANDERGAANFYCTEECSEQGRVPQREPVANPKRRRVVQVAQPWRP
eukprot:TRINITY_DN20116_c0_g1_i5.p1 TRINITY_DN20116_c0_g1~~TRINITY_DN20116_c0_g1_i5.p1  ORF type:complete len:959 (+),score=229.84 TRINITY_DN20116_c0_g1_i5:467-3343(+)